MRHRCQVLQTVVGLKKVFPNNIKPQIPQDILEETEEFIGSVQSGNYANACIFASGIEERVKDPHLLHPPTAISKYVGKILGNWVNRDGFSMQYNLGILMRITEKLMPPKPKDYFSLPEPERPLPNY